MKIYVDKMPKCCNECCFCKLNTYVDIYKEQINSYECVLDGSMLTNNCPLLTTQFLKQQAREEVVDEICYNLSRIEDTLINCGNGKEDALAYFCEILKKVKGVPNVKD